MKKILEKIKEYNTIIIHGHIRPDGDCIGSQYGLKYLIEENFPEKKVYVTGDSSEYVSFIGKPELIDEKLFKGALSIIVDCPDSDRLSDKRFNLSDYSIKIDHHFDSNKFTDYEYIDYKAASCTSIITELYMMFKDELKMSSEAATALYVGLLTDTGRFQNLNVTSKTFMIASELIQYIDIVSINELLNLEDEKQLRFKGFCLNNFKITENGFAYITVTKEDLIKYDIDLESGSSLISTISTLKTCPIWALFIETDDNIRVRLRSRGPAINEYAKKYNGGGHKLASGCSLNNWSELDDFVNGADLLVKEYKKLR